MFDWSARVDRRAGESSKSKYHCVLSSLCTCIFTDFGAPPPPPIILALTLFFHLIQRWIKKKKELGAD